MDTTETRTESNDTPDTVVPAGESAIECPYCGRPFTRERYRTLHVGLDHHDRLTDDEREAFVETYRAETDAIRTVRLKMLGALVALYFGFLYVYLIVV